MLDPIILDDVIIFKLDFTNWMRAIFTKRVEIGVKVSDVRGLK